MCRFKNKECVASQAECSCESCRCNGCPVEKCNWKDTECKNKTI